MPSTSPIPAANFTEVARAAATAEAACYHLPQDLQGTESRRAVARNSKLREDNITVPSPYIQSIDFAGDGVHPLFLTVRDNAEDTFFLDVSNQSRVAISDDAGNSLLLDNSGVYFASNSCRYDVNITIRNMYTQLINLSEIDCPDGIREPSRFYKRSRDIQFNQTLFLHDQCGSPVTKSIKDYPELEVGNTTCRHVKVDEAIGRWDFDCTFPGSASGTLQCQRAVQDDIINFLLTDALGGICLDLTSVISTLAATATDIINGSSLRDGLFSRGVKSDAERDDVEAAVLEYEALWRSLQGFFVSANANTTAEALKPWGRYFSVYNAHRNFQEDICEYVHGDEIPLGLNLRVGVTYFDPITTLNWAPQNPPPHNLTVQNPSAVACCPNGSITKEDGNGTCAYPSSAFIDGTDCICGRVSGGESIAFETAECGNFAGSCRVDEDCLRPGFVCLIGSCCGTGVCIDPYACSQNGTSLIKGEPVFN
jgi:hypothetical protein